LGAAARALGERLGGLDEVVVAHVEVRLFHTGLFELVGVVVDAHRPGLELERQPVLLALVAELVPCRLVVLARVELLGLDELVEWLHHTAGAPDRPADAKRAPEHVAELAAGDQRLHLGVVLPAGEGLGLDLDARAVGEVGQAGVERVRLGAGARVVAQRHAGLRRGGRFRGGGRTGRRGRGAWRGRGGWRGSGRRGVVAAGAAPAGAVVGAAAG